MIRSDSTDSNVAWRNELFRAQHFLNSLIEHGIRIDFNNEQPKNACASIRVNFDPDSNVNDESRLHPKKELSPRNSTEAGRQSDFNEEQ
jgi:hypothetical protein